MPSLTINSQNALFYLYNAPTAPEGKTFVFFNALTGDTGMWEESIGDILRSRGHGTLSFNFRGQADSPFGQNIRITADLIVDDARRLLNHVKPKNVVLAGLSIGGLFAARTWHEGIDGIDCDGLVMINTLRREGPRLKWINDALVRCVEIGGLDMFRDLYAPLLFNEEWQETNRHAFLKPEHYTPISKKSGHYNLLSNAGTANWNFPYEELALPVLLVTGLQDHVFLDLAIVDELSARIPNAERIDMENAAHLLPAERPQELAGILSDFAARI